MDVNVYSGTSFVLTDLRLIGTIVYTILINNVQLGKSTIIHLVKKNHAAYEKKKNIILLILQYIHYTSIKIHLSNSTKLVFEFI